MRRQLTTKDLFHLYRHVRRNGIVVYVTERHRDRLYKRGDMPANYPVPAIPTRVEYIFGYGLVDGIFIRVEGYIVAGAYRDGMEVTGYPCILYDYDYPDEV